MMLSIKMEEIQKMNKGALVLLNLVFCGFVLLSCVTTDTSKVSETDKKTEIPLETTIPMPDLGAKNEDLIKSVTSLIEKATPVSLRQAADLLLVDKTPFNLSGSNQSLLALAGQMMSILYPLERWDYAIPINPIITPYLDAVASAKIGVYDYNSGNFDYLSLTLPSLVLLYSPRDAYYADSRAALQKAISLKPSNILAKFLLGVLSECEGKLSEAESFYNQVLKTDPENYTVIMRLTSVLLLKDDGTAALKLAMPLLERFPNSSEVIELCARSCFAVADWSRADALVTKVLTQEPSNAEFLLMRIRILIESKEYLKANSFLEGYGKNNPQNKTFLLLKARLQREWNHNMTLASQTISEAVTKYPNDIAVLLEAAQVCFAGDISIENVDGAGYIAKVLAVSPDNLTARRLQVSDAVSRRNWATAISGAQSILKNSEDIQVSILLAKAYIGRGESNRALNVLTPLYQDNPTDNDLLSLYLQALIDSGYASKASSLISSQLTSATSTRKSILLYHRSRLASTEEILLSDLRSSLLSDPRNGDSLFAMYSYYYGKKDYRRASYYLKQVISLNPGDSYYQKLNTELTSLIK